MAFSKIILNNVTQIDLTQDTVAAELLSSYTAHGADGQAIVGTIPSATLPTTLSSTPVGTRQGDFLPSDYLGIKYLNIPAGYNDSDKNYAIYHPYYGSLFVTQNGEYYASDQQTYDAFDYINVNIDDDNFIVTLSWDDDYFGANEGAWVPDKTVTEIKNAHDAEKQIIFTTDTGLLPCSYFFDDDYVVVYSVAGDSDAPNTLRFTNYIYTVNGIEGPFYDDAIYPNFDTPSVTYTPTTSQQTDTITYDPSNGYNGIEEVSVTINAMPSGTAETPATTVTANPTISVNSSGLITASVSKAQNITPTVSAGYVSSGTAGTITVSGSTTSQLSTVGASTVSPTESQQTAVAAGKYTTGEIKVGAIPSTYVGSGITTRSSASLTVSGATVTAPAGYYSAAATKSVASGTAGTPTATKGTVSNHSITVTPSVTNTTGYITGGTKTGTAVTVSASELVSGTYSITSTGTKDITNYAAASVSAGTEGTPTATKGTVSNHQVTVTPSVTNSAGYISGGTKTGTAVTVTATELASGNKSITANGTNIDVIGYQTVSVAVPFSTIYTGSSAPSSSTGSNGDIYIQTS